MYSRDTGRGNSTEGGGGSKDLLQPRRLVHRARHLLPPPAEVRPQLQRLLPRLCQRCLQRTALRAQSAALVAARGDLLGREGVSVQ